jgi:hypothetical protein
MTAVAELPPPVRLPEAADLEAVSGLAQGIDGTYERT